jgi:hypothetical protein
MVSELGDFQDVIDALWSGDIVPKFNHDGEPTIGYRKLIGYVDHGKEVMFNEQPEGIHVG